MTDELPRGWALATVGDVAYFVRGVTYSKEHARNVPVADLVPVLRATNIGDALNYDDLVYVPNRFVSDEQIVQNGDVVLAMSSGSKSVVGKAAVATNPIRCGFGAFCGVIRPSKDISHSLLGYYFQTKAYRNAVSDVSKGSNINNLKAEHVLDRPLPIPPKAEQARIASKIDELFSRIDEGERALDRVQKLVERYRQSVLKAAVTGELTRDWREKNKEKLESGEALLARILKARREAWEKAELDKMKAKGVTPANDKWKLKYEEPAAPDTTGLPELPDGWVWATVDQLSADVAYGTSAKCNGDSSGVPVVRMGNLVAGRLDLRDLKYLPHDHNEFPSLLLRTGDLLFNRTNSAELVGKSAVFSGHDGLWSFASYLIRVRTVVVNAEWLAHFINSAFGRAWVASVKNEQVGQANVNGSKLKALAVPLPPEAEMSAALDAIATNFGRVQSAANSNASETLRVNLLRQAVLRAAFAGNLVIQDPTDEPASVLLERIAAERDAAPASPKRGRKPRASAPA